MFRVYLATMRALRTLAIMEEVLPTAVFPRVAFHNLTLLPTYCLGP